jgi:hypothetical protein
MKRWRTTLIVVAIFVALAAYVLLVEVKREPPAEQEPTPTPLPLLSLSIDDVQSLRISGGASTAGMRVLDVAHNDLEWRLSTTDPDAAAGTPCLANPDGCLADPYIIHLAVDDLCHLGARRALLEQVSELAQYGLDPIALTIEIATGSGGHQKIYIGRQTPDGMDYYVQREGDPRLYLVAQYTLQPFFEWLKELPLELP